MSKKFIHVAAAVIKNGGGQILIAKRSADQHQGGLWEFPGGKIEPGEPVTVALARELEEELGIEVTHSSPLIKVPHHYADKSVLLDVYEVTQFNGEAWGREGQPVEWVNPGDLDKFQFPAANKPILNACLLPDSWFITPEHISEVDEFIKKIDQAQHLGAKGVMLRAHHLNDQQFKLVVSGVRVHCEAAGLAFVINRDCKLANQSQASGLHLSSSELKCLGYRNEFSGRWLSASCHSLEEIEMAVMKELDFVTLSPVSKTTSHPEADALGWEAFKGIVDQCPIPVYALGGISSADLSKAKDCGAQGIAAISAWLEG
ncbi:MAG: Nudix family hydrolase [Neptuniibacter sp.]